MKGRGKGATMDGNSTFEILCRAMAAAYFAQIKPAGFSTITTYLRGVFRDAEDTDRMNKLADELYQSVRNMSIFSLPDAPEKVIRVIASRIHKGQRSESDLSTKKVALFMGQMMYWCGVLDCLLQKQDVQGREDEILPEIRAMLSKYGKIGMEKRFASMRILKGLAIALYQERYPPGTKISTNKAAHALKDEVIAHGRTIGAILSESNAQHTIAKWIRKMCS
jgi:hypothetical protein